MSRRIVTQASHRWALALLVMFTVGLGACRSGAGTGVGPDVQHPPTKGPTPTLVPPAEIDIAGSLDSSGVAAHALRFASPDGCLVVEAAAGSSLRNASDLAPQRLVISQDYPGQLPVEAYGVSIGFAYTFGPDEVRFTPPARLIFTCTERVRLALPSELSLGALDGQGGWEQQSVQRDDLIGLWTRVEILKPGWRYMLVGPVALGS